MTGAQLLFIAVGALAILVGGGMIVAGVRRGPGTSPAATVLLIAGMMLASFGALLAAFALQMAVDPASAPDFQGAN